MPCSVFICTLVAISATTATPDESQQQTRPITNAESVLAVYREDHGLDSRGTPAIIFAAWPDGRVVWSRDSRNGGAPYRVGTVDPQKVMKLLARFEKDGLFSDKELNQGKFGPDSQFTTVFIKSGAVVTSTGVSGLEGRRRLDVLKNEPADYLHFRFVWSETRSMLRELIPDGSEGSVGTPVMQAGALSWQESAK